MSGFNRKEKGPTLKPNSLKLGTCQGRNSFTLNYQTLFSNVCGLPLRIAIYMVNSRHPMVGGHEEWSVFLDLNESQV